MGIKLWVDDVRPAPEGYEWVKSVNEAKEYIVASENSVKRKLDRARQAFLDRDEKTRVECSKAASAVAIDLIDLDHDAGDYAKDGGDYIKLLDWLEETGRSGYFIKSTRRKPTSFRWWVVDPVPHPKPGRPGKHAPYLPEKWLARAVRR